MFHLVLFIICVCAVIKYLKHRKERAMIKRSFGIGAGIIKH
jgi:hypothetical protein